MLAERLVHVKYKLNAPEGFLDTIDHKTQTDMPLHATGVASGHLKLNMGLRPESISSMIL